MKITTKLCCTSGALALTGLIAGGAGVWYLRLLGEQLTTATKVVAVRIDLINASRARSWEMVAAVRTALLGAQVGDEQGVEASMAQWNAAFLRAHEQIRDLRPLMSGEESTRELSAFEASLEEFGRTSEEVARLCRNRQVAEGLAAAAGVERFARQADDSLTAMKNGERTRMKDAQIRAADVRRQSMTVVTVTSGILLGLVAVACVAVAGIRRDLKTVAGELWESARQVEDAAGQVSSSSQSLASASSEQAAGLEETSASSEEVNAMARRNGENSRAAADVAAQSQRRFAETRPSLERMTTAMKEINAQSGKIANVIRIIDEIAFQTNILALNAAVEAARAGEAGAGFAVVADEVRNLAQRSAQAAKDTASLIEESIARSGEAKAHVDQVVAAIHAIIDESSRVKTLAEEVSTGSQEQTEGMRQIGATLTQLEKVTLGTAASAEEGAAAAQELNAQSVALRTVVQRLTAMVGAGGALTAADFAETA